MILTFSANNFRILNIMKKVFKNIPLHHFLIVMVLLISSFSVSYSNIAFSETYSDNNQKIPIKRPSNFLNLEESADTIFNMIQKVGGKPTVNSKSTILRKNETLSSALKRINFDNDNINKIIQSVNKLNNSNNLVFML